MRKAFTMIELIFVIVIIAIVATIIIPKMHPNNLNEDFKVEQQKAINKHSSGTAEEW